jgi:tRNA threonylcarbamoyladenosine biosynthesis protein TsaB
MLILTIRTDNPTAEVALFDGTKQVDHLAWLADRQLAETIHLTIKELLDTHGKTINDLQAVAVYKGPGSFTGVRIGLSVANALAAGLAIPIVSGTGDDWLQKTTTKLQKGEDQKLALPEYGAPPHITPPKK